MELSTLYWLLILPSVGGAMLLMGAFSTVGFGVICVLSLFDDCPWHKKVKFNYIIIPIFMWLAGILIPSEKQMMYLIGGYAATNVENIEKLPKNVVDAANKFLEDYTTQDKK
jgi:hypothetical protein